MSIYSRIYFWREELKVFLYHEPTGAINLPSAWVFTSAFFRLCCVAFRLYFVRWACLFIFFLMNIFNSFNRCLRGKSLQYSLLSSTWAVHASVVLWHTPGVWAGGKAQRKLVSSFLTVVTVIPSWYLYFFVFLPTEGCINLCRHVQWHHHSVLTHGL